jgi:hypothetical protein
MANNSRCGFMTNKDFLRISRMTLIPQLILVNPNYPGDKQLLEATFVELEDESTFLDLKSERLAPARLVSSIVWPDCACQGCPK